MDVKAIIREVFAELSSKGTPAAPPGTQGKFLPIRRLYLDPFVDEHNARSSTVEGEARKPVGPDGARSDSPPPEIGAKKSP